MVHLRYVLSGGSPFASVSHLRPVSLFKCIKFVLLCYHHKVL